MSNDFWKDYEPEPTKPAPMTTDRALDLALEALEHIDYEDNDRDFLFPYQCTMLDNAITAIKQARSAPVQEPDHSDELTIAYMSGVHRGKELAVAQAVPDAFGTREGEHPQYIQGWNDCRAEMLSMRKRVKP